MAAGTEALEVVTVLPPTSWTFTTGWVANAVAYEAPAASVVTVSVAAAPMVTVTLAEVAEVSPVEAAVRV